MKLARLIHRMTFRAGIVVIAAMMALAFSSTAARHIGLPGAAAAPADPAGAEGSPAAQTSARADGKSTLRPAQEIRGASPYLEVKNEPAPKLIVDPPLPDLLDQGVVWIQWRAENVHIVPVFGKGALTVSPRVGHLHVHMDDLPWLWADASDINTIDLAGVPPGPHKILLELVNSNHEVFPGQAKTVAFTVPKTASATHH